MSDEIVTPWQGDWNRRLNSAIARLGYQTLEELFEANPDKTYYALAQMLDANLAPMQLYGTHIRDAKGRGLLRYAAQDCIVRVLNEYLRRGWGQGRHFASRCASAYAAWKSIIIQFGDCNDDIGGKLDEVWNALESCNPPNGWKPVGKSDEYIKSAFSVGWPEDADHAHRDL